MKKHIQKKQDFMIMKLLNNHKHHKRNLRNISVYDNKNNCLPDIFKKTLKKISSLIIERICRIGNSIIQYLLNFSN
jgi:uncharacterized membrane protein YgaE (UPF0421/DUF939 family)